MNFDNVKLEFPVDWHARIITDVKVENVAIDIQRVLLGFAIQNPLRQGNRSRSGKFVSYAISATINDAVTFKQIHRALQNIKGVKMIV